MLPLRPGWFIKDVPERLSLDAPGIYEWRIKGVGLYVGKAKKLKGRLPAYPRNVTHIISGRSWHGQPGKEVRPIHDALRLAYQQGVPVTVAVLENCEVAELNQRERFWIQLRRQEALEGGLPVLNSN